MRSADSGFDQRHVFNASYIYVLPGGSSRNRLIKYLLGGWEIAGITTLESGRPFNITINFDNANNGARSNAQRPNFIGNPLPSGFKQTIGPGGAFFNTAAFTVAPPYTFGNVGRNALHGPAHYNTDVAGFKNFNFTERYKLQFRAEFFNAFNNSNFDNPHATLGNADFGTITATYPGLLQTQRQIQFGLKLLF